MSGKTLSNGTLSLKFMQNAQRAKLQAQVEAEQAKIKDDAEWSVSQEVRDAWGIGQSSSNSNEVQHESSYIPFIFQSDVGEGSSSGTPSSSSSPVFRGRRTFNARGKEVIHEESKISETGEAGVSRGELQRDPKPDADPLASGERPRSKFEKLPTSISGFRAPVSAQREAKKPRMKTAQMLIREDMSVRPPPSLGSPDPTSLPRAAGFVKPSGVDEPPPPRTDSRKRDRDVDPSSEQTGSEGKKKKKRKEKVTGS